MSRLDSHHRAFVARGLAVILLIVTAILAFPLATPNFADDPPPGLTASDWMLVPNAASPTGFVWEPSP